MWIYIAHCHKVSNALGALVPAEKPSFQTVSEGLIVLLCTKVVRQGVPRLLIVRSDQKIDANAWCHVVYTMFPGNMTLH